MKSVLKKSTAWIAVLFLILTFSLSALADDTVTFIGSPSSTDQVSISITGITGTPTLRLYKIARANYGSGSATGTELNGTTPYVYADGAAFANAMQPTAGEITTIAQGLVGGTIESLPLDPADTVVPSGPIESVTVTGSSYTKTVFPGQYIAVLTGARDGSVYNPILLSASYGSSGDKGTLVGGSVASGANYLYGSATVAKKSNPGVSKTADKDSASLGETVTFTLNMVIPSYPAEAKNKTVYFSDNLCDGLTLDYNSLAVILDGTKLSMSDNQFVNAGNVVAKAYKEGNGFNIAFVYDEIASAGTVKVTYNATVNAKAVSGSAGNTNAVAFAYSNNPTTGKTYDDPVPGNPDNPETPGDPTDPSNPNPNPDPGKPDVPPGTPTDKPDEDKGLHYTYDVKTIYTYRVAIIKTDDKKELTPLEGAVFGVFSGDTQVDTITSDSTGVAVSKQLGAGTYSVKELIAPAGYALNTTPVEVTANKDTAVTTRTASVVSYTTKPSGTKAVAGYLKDGVFYSTTAENKPSDAVPAYEADTETTNIVTVTNSAEKTTIKGIVEKTVKDTKLSALPSTGSKGAYIFTVIGAAVMIIFALLLFITRKSEEDE